MSKVQIVFEGNETLKLPLLKFFGKAVPGSERFLKLRPGKGREDAIKDFLTIASRSGDPFTILLIDSECPDDGMLFEGMNWTGLVSRGQVAWMVQVMESWFLADPKALIGYYNDPNILKRLPGHPNVELAPKDDVLSGLKQAARHVGREYHKGADAAKLLELLNPAEVRKRASHCDRLLTIIEERIGQ